MLLTFYVILYQLFTNFFSHTSVQINLQWKASGFCTSGAMWESLERIINTSYGKQKAVDIFSQDFICVVVAILCKYCLSMYENSLSFNAPGVCFVLQSNPLFTATSKKFYPGSFLSFIFPTACLPIGSEKLNVKLLCFNQ